MERNLEICNDFVRTNANNYRRQCDLEEKSVKRRNSKWS